MAYAKTNWTNTTPINTTNLNNIENGISANDTAITTINTNIGNLSNLTTPDKSSLVGAINSIVESGSNANGTYEKYADGQLIQYGTGSCPEGVGYADITFPIPFLNAEYIMLTNHKYTGGGGYGGSAQLRNITNPQANTNDTAYIYSYMYDGTIATYIRNVQYIAIGRWK